MPGNESCMEKCTNSENDPFVFCDGSSGDLTQMYVLWKQFHIKFFLALASVMAAIFSVLGVG